jgi:predicted dehydrogenase
MTQQGSTTRRRFIGTAIMAGAVVPYVPWTATAFANAAANDRPRIGCIGTGSMGLGDAVGHARFGDILAVCDVDKDRADRAKYDVRIGNGKADTYSDYRKLLARSDIDVVSIVTTDHWHVKIAVEALHAGKHVFCQKPLSLTLEENKIARAAAEKYPHLQFFIGTQQRSQKDEFLRAVNMIHKGLLGTVKRVTAGISSGHTGGPFPIESTPGGLDWEMWLGQAPKVPYRNRRCHDDFRWWYEYSGGKFTDWGAHHVDIAQWAIGEDTMGKGPIEINGVDARHPVPFKDGYPTVDDCYNTAYDFSVSCRFSSGTELIVTSRGDNGLLFEGTKGRMFVNRAKMTGTPIEEQWDKDKFGDEDLKTLYKGKPFEDHKANFYRCIREGGLPVSDVFSHIIAMNTCHLAAIAARLGRTITWDPAAEAIVGDEQAAAFASRTPREGYAIERSLYT